MTNKIKTLSEQLQNKAISPKELIQETVSNIKKLNPILNAFIYSPQDNFDFNLDLDLNKNLNINHSILNYIPIAHKDNIAVKNMPMTCASKMLKDFKPPYNASLVNKLNQSGVVCVGKLNMDEFAMGSGNTHSYFGPVKNPWDLSKVPGGSSGGSAAAVAAGMVPAATGTDTGGSIRQPAAFCNISGLKPTYGRVSRYGMVAFGSSFDQAGPMARTAEECAYLLNSMAGEDLKDSTSFIPPKYQNENFTKNLDQSIQNKTLGIIPELMQNLPSDYLKIYLNALDIFKKLGVNTIELKLPHYDLALPIYYVLASAECTSNLSRFDGVHYGYRAENPKDLEDLYIRSRTEGFGEEVKRRLLTGTYSLASEHFHDYYVKAQKIRRLIQNDFLSAFNQCDLLFLPTTPTTAFDIDREKKSIQNNNPTEIYNEDIYTVGANLAGIPAISIPSGFYQNLPTGLQLLGPHFSESLILNFAHQFQNNTDFHTVKPQIVGV